MTRRVFQLRVSLDEVAPEIWRRLLVPAGYTLDRLLEALGGGRIEPVPIPHDCRDGFLHAYWRRPRAYLDRNPPKQMPPPNSVRRGALVYRIMLRPPDCRV